jgi:hypothetical protein
VPADPTRSMSEKSASIDSELPAESEQWPELGLKESKNKQDLITLVTFKSKI